MTTVPLAFAACLAVLASSGQASAAALAVKYLKCEYRTKPLGLDRPRPRLSWQLVANERNQLQTAYQILAASDPSRLAPGKADLWDTGKVPSAQSVHVLYQGQPVHSGQRVFWMVRAWDRNDKPSGYSSPAWWEMALLAPADWQAQWITRQTPTIPGDDPFADHPAPLFRKEFVLDKKIARARVYVSGLGYYELRLNGERVGDHLLDPGWTTYSERVLYSTYDVTRQLQRGPNALGVMLGNGWFNPLPLRLWNSINLREHLTIGQPRFILRLVVDFADGTSRAITSDETWEVGDGPILRNNVYLGEAYDARKEKPGWDRPGFGAADWEPVVAATEALGPLRAQDAPPIRLTRTLKPVRVTEPKPGVFIYDFGQNFAGWARLRVKGPAGARIRMRYGELLYPDGTLNGMTAVCGQIKQGGPNYHYDGKGAPKTAFQMDEYILKGDGQEVYTPRFTFHGFRYVEVTSEPSEVRVTSLEGLRLNSDVASAGSFECSNPLFNRIQQMVLWTELSNLFSVESDCPHREKFGYGGDIVAASEMALFNFDMARFYAKAVDDLGDAVRPNGGFTETAPFVGIASDGLGEKAGPVGWGTAQPLLQWQLYQYYGDRALLEANYETTKRWISFLHSCARDGILDNGISDHESLVAKPRALTGTVFYYLNVTTFSRIARALGKETDALSAERLAEQIKTAFNTRFLQRGTGCYDIATQACQAFALDVGLVPPEEQHRALAVLVRDIEDTHQGHLTTGIFGTKFMLQALAEAGRSDVAFNIVNQRSFPGWGHMLANGATTLWEHWEFSDNTYSHNHPMFGSVSEWFYKVPAGINLAADAVACDRILIKPQPVGDLTWVKAGYDSVRGKIVSEWGREGRTFRLRVRVPVGATATVFLPATPSSPVTESGAPLERARGVQFLRWERARAVLGIGSGEYNFASTLE